MIQGAVERWRIDRRNAHLIHSSMVSEPADMFAVLPLPFDDELVERQEKENEQSKNAALVSYEMARAAGYFDKPV